MESGNRVIVLRGWLEHDGVRVRILVSDGARRQWVVVGAKQAAAVVEALLAELAGPPGEDGGR
ncbi:hypothetical protein BJ973_004063 [Actinoplanes tereljensis]|uniref:Uncharacterized protein n=1 Tax=Paractinoplanes tereljensis TaxID=571912 RepID=A0A919TV21_9ACTN|nr:hypothetical protein [Actinoplanes tereljensis]GIF23451.1 hypothetical protein Ate02nite_61810 [Actinoplanes tereljensis]